MALCWLLYSYCSEFAWLFQWGSGLMLVCNVSHLENQQFEHFKPCPIHGTTFKWVYIKFTGFAKSVILLEDNSTYRNNFVHIQATGSSHNASEFANNANDVCHTNGDLHAANIGDLHAANIGNHPGSDNNGDHASIMWWLCLVAKHGCGGGFFFCSVVLLHTN